MAPTIIHPVLSLSLHRHAEGLAGDQLAYLRGKTRRFYIHVVERFGYARLGLEVSGLLAKRAALG